MRDQLVLRSTPHRAEREHPGVVAELARDLGLAPRLRRAAGEAGDEHHRARGPFADRVDGELQDRLVEAGVADRELSGVHADGDAARTGVDVVARERALPPRVEAAVRIEREQVRRDHRAVAQDREDVRGNVVEVSDERHLSRAPARRSRTQAAHRRPARRDDTACA